MIISVVGAGYVGLSTGICLAEIGHKVVCIDVDEKKISQLKKGNSPIYEPGMDMLLRKNLQAGSIRFTSSYQEGLDQAEIIILAVGTPEKEDGSPDLSYLEHSAAKIGKHLRNNAVIAVKSTVPVGANEFIGSIIRKKLHPGLSIEMVSNPEFLREGSAIKDMFHADRIIIGFENKEAGEKVRRMYSKLSAPVLMTDIRSAELIKYASNAFLAAKISFINQIADLCEAVGADVKHVAKGMGMDQRIGGSFLHAGIGYGGSCLPKDVKGLIHTGRQNGIDLSIVKAADTVNEERVRLFVKKISDRFKILTGRKLALLGLAFKPDTDDMREAPSVKIAKAVTELGAKVTAFDPKAQKNARRILGDTVQFANSIWETVKDADAVIIVTEWKEFRQINLPKMFSLMKEPIIFDGRNCLNDEKIDAIDHIEYYPIGRPDVIGKSIPDTVINDDIEE